jgi:hypothetical protein
MVVSEYMGQIAFAQIRERQEDVGGVYACGLAKEASVKARQVAYLS